MNEHQGSLKSVGSPIDESTLFQTIPPVSAELCSIDGAVQMLRKSHYTQRLTRCNTLSDSEGKTGGIFTSVYKAILFLLCDIC